MFLRAQVRRPTILSRSLPSGCGICAPSKCVATFFDHNEYAFLFELCRFLVFLCLFGTCVRFRPSICCCNTLSNLGNVNMQAGPFLKRALFSAVPPDTVVTALQKVCSYCPIRSISSRLSFLCSFSCIFRPRTLIFPCLHCNQQFCVPLLDEVVSGVLFRSSLC